MLNLNKKRGYFGIGLYMPKTSHNIGTLWRSAKNMGADFMFTIGTRAMISQASDTEKGYKYIPFYVYPDLDSFILPTGCRLVGIEQTEDSVDLIDFVHYERACYILGSEDNGLSNKVQEYCTGGIVHINTPSCLNVSVAGSIVMYDRMLKTK